MKTRDKTTWILKTICQVREKGGRRGVLQIIFAPLRLECGEKGLSCVPETREEAEEEGWGAISRVMLLFFARPSVLKVGTGFFFIYFFGCASGSPHIQPDVFFFFRCGGVHDENPAA